MSSRYKCSARWVALETSNLNPQPVGALVCEHELPAKAAPTPGSEERNHEQEKCGRCWHVRSHLVSMAFAESESGVCSLV